MSNIGLIVVTLAWFVQYRYKKGSLSPLFLVLYLAGVLCLIYDGIRSGLGTLAGLNAASFLMASAVMYRTVMKR